MAAERVYTFLVLRAKGGKPKRIVVWDTQDISVGRAPENDLVLEDPEASRNHAQFFRGEAGHSVKSFSLSNATYVNETAIESQALKNKDVVRIAETELVFYKVTQNPVTLGLPLEYASQLKNFGGAAGKGDGEATILGLVDALPNDDFQVRPAGDFEHDLHGIEAPRTRNLDQELSDDGLGDPLDMPAKGKGGAGLGAFAREEAKPDTFAVQLEIQGLTGPQRASLAALLGKVIELPKLRIRIKGDDLG